MTDERDWTPETTDDPIQYQLRDAYIRSLPRAQAVAEGIRFLIPQGMWPNKSEAVEAGGAPPPPEGIIRPKLLMQDPDVDPTEPQGGEGGNKGHDHGWANCLMSSAAMVWCYHKQRVSGPWGGDMRHHQNDMEGGTDLWDAQLAWERWGGQHLGIRNGEGWDALKYYRNTEGRAILAIGNGHNPSGSSFTGYHACVIGLENKDTTNGPLKWLFGDPLLNDWKFCEPSDIRAWMERVEVGLQFGISKQLHTPVRVSG